MDLMKGLEHPKGPFHKHKLVHMDRNSPKVLSEVDKHATQMIVRKANKWQWFGELVLFERRAHATFTVNQPRTISRSLKRYRPGSLLPTCRDMHAHMDFQPVNCNRSCIAKRSAREPATDLPTGKQNRRHIVIRGNTAIVSVIA
jgi:hypothetical protein